MGKRVVVSGVGTINAIGCDTTQYWNGILAGISGISAKMFEDIKKTFKVGDIKGFVSTSKEENFFADYLIHSISEALNDSKVGVSDLPDTPLFIGTALGNISQIETQLIRFNHDRFDSYNIAESIRPLKRYFGLKMNPFIVSSTCTSSMNALGMAYLTIKDGMYDRVIVAGCETLNSHILAGIRSTKGMALDSMKPFDLARSGMLLGEGAGAVVIETLENAEKRNAHIYAEIAGYKSYSEAYHLMVPDLTGENINKALDYDISQTSDTTLLVSANGTKYNDEAIYNGLLKKYGNNHPLVADIKAIIGHTLGASGIVEGIAAIKSIETQTALPLYGVENAMSGLRYLKKPKDMELKNIIHVSTSFGGNIASIHYKSVNLA